jgi:hypothetical protein
LIVGGRKTVPQPAFIINKCFFFFFFLSKSNSDVTSELLFDKKKEKKRKEKKRPILVKRGGKGTGYRPLPISSPRWDDRFVVR